MKSEHKAVSYYPDWKRFLEVQDVLFLGAHNSPDCCFNSGVRCIVKKLIRDKSESVVYRFMAVVQTGYAGFDKGNSVTEIPKCSVGKLSPQEYTSKPTLHRLNYHKADFL